MKKQNKIYWIVAVVVIIVLVVFLSLNNKEKINEKIKIGALVPLTGDVASWGEAMKKGFDLALVDSGIKNVELIYEDDKCEPATGVTATHKLIDVDKVTAVAGTTCSSVTLAIAPIFEQNKTILMAIGSSAPDITNSGDYIFRMWPSDNYEASLMGKYISGLQDNQNLSVLYSNNDYGLGFKNALEEEYKKSGKTILFSEPFKKGDSDLRTQLTKIKELKTDGIFLIGVPADLKIILKQIAEMNIESQLFSTVNIIEPQILSESTVPVDGIVYGELEMSQDLKQKLIDSYGNEGESVLASSFAYDGMMLILNSIKECGGNSSCIKNELYKVKGYEGVSGITSFDKNGDPVDRNFIIKTIKNRVPSVLEN